MHNVSMKPTLDGIIEAHDYILEATGGRKGIRDYI